MKQTANFSTLDEELLDTLITLCPIHHGVGKECCPPSQTDLGCDVAEQQSCLSPTAPWPPLVHVPGACGGSLFQNSLGAFPLSRGDPVCPSGQTGCCVKQQRPISDGISQSAPAGLRGRAGYQHQQRWLLVAPLGPVAPFEPCLNSGSGERFRTWFRAGLGARGQCQQQIPRHCSSPALADGLQNLQPHVLSLPRPAVGGISAVE